MISFANCALNEQRSLELNVESHGSNPIPAGCIRLTSDVDNLSSAAELASRVLADFHAKKTAANVHNE